MTDEQQQEPLTMGERLRTRGHRTERQLANHHRLFGTPVPEDDQPATDDDAGPETAA